MTTPFPRPDFELAGFDVATFIRATLAEALGEGLPGGGRDVTSESVIPAEARFAGVMDSRDAITVAGLPLAAAFFRHLDPGVEIDRVLPTRRPPGRGGRPCASAGPSRLTAGVAPNSL